MTKAKKTAAKKATPARKQASKPQSNQAIVAPRSEKKTHKLPPAGAQAIIDLTVAGLSVADIISQIKADYGVTISDRLVTYYRWTMRDALLISVEDEVKAARSKYPDAMFLVGRVGKAEEALRREFAKKRFSGMTVAALLAEERQNAMQVEVLRIRARESAAKYPEHVDGETECILQELERRSVLYRRVDAEAERFAQLAGPEFQDNEIVARVEIVPDSGRKPEGQNVPNRGGNGPESTLRAEAEKPGEAHHADAIAANLEGGEGEEGRKDEGKPEEPPDTDPLDGLEV